MYAKCFKQPAYAATLIQDAEQGFNDQGAELQCFFKVQSTFSSAAKSLISFYRKIHLCKI